MNKNENIVEYPGLGKVHYISNRRSRNLSIRISPGGEVRVSVPSMVSFRKAESFVISRFAWIRKKLHEIEERKASAPVLKEGDYIRIRGWDIPVELQNGDQSLEDAVWRILLREAKEYLPGRVEELARRHGLLYKGLKIRRMKTRWGSCTAGDSINLNSWLVMLPDYLSDYVILHELCHTIHKDHSSRFWLSLDKFTEGQALSLRKALRKEQIMGLRFV